jgi:hypothetical protein
MLNARSPAPRVYGFAIDDSGFQTWKQEQEDKPGKETKAMDEASDGEFTASQQSLSHDDYAGAGSQSKLPYKKSHGESVRSLSGDRAFPSHAVPRDRRMSTTKART